jgi:hypothetical protein
MKRETGLGISRVNQKSETETVYFKNHITVLLNAYLSVNFYSVSDITVSTKSLPPPVSSENF